MQQNQLLSGLIAELDKLHSLSNFLIIDTSSYDQSAIDKLRENQLDMIDKACSYAHLLNASQQPSATREAGLTPAEHS